MENELPKPGTKFRVKPGCAAAYRAGDATALENGEGQTVEFISVRPIDCRNHPGQWTMLWRGPRCDKEIVVGPRWLERIEEENVPSPPVAGKGVHAQSLVGDGAKTKEQSPAENPRARRNMSEPLKIETQTLLNGVPLKSMSKGDILGQIKFQEDEIGRLEKIAHKPASLSAELDDRKAAIEQLIKLVDAFDAESKAAEPVTRAELAAALAK